jgi:hypothetical protein
LSFSETFDYELLWNIRTMKDSSEEEHIHRSGLHLCHAAEFGFILQSVVKQAVRRDFRLFRVD